LAQLGQSSQVGTGVDYPHESLKIWAVSSLTKPCGSATRAEVVSVVWLQTQPWLLSFCDGPEQYRQADIRKRDSRLSLADALRRVSFDQARLSAQTQTAAAREGGNTIVPPIR